MLPDFNRLRIFYYVFLHKGIAAAADRLNITQPAVSQQIAKLEDELDTVLFLRVKKRLVPTSEGQSLFNTLVPFISQLTRQVDEFQKSKTEPSGLLRIGMPYEFGKKYMPDVCAKFYKKYPQVRYYLRFGDTATLLSLLQKGEIDLAGIDTLKGEGILEWEKHSYMLTPVFSEDIILVCSKEYFVNTMQSDGSLENLIRQPFVTDEDDGISVTNWFRHHYGITPGIPGWLMTAKSHSVIVDCIKYGMGLGITSSHFIRDEIATGTIHLFQTDKEPITNYVSLAYIADKPLSQTETKFIGSFRTLI